MLLPISLFFLFFDWVVFQFIDIPRSLHFSVTGHFGGFYVLAIVNCATFKIGAHVSFQMMNFSRSKPGKGLQDHMMRLCLVFQRTSMLFSLMASPVTFPPRLWEDSLICTSSVVLFFVDLFDNGHCDQWEVIPHCSLIGIYLIITGVEYPFMCFYYFIPYEYNLPLETWPCLEFFSHNLPQDIFEGRCHLQLCHTCDY